MSGFSSLLSYFIEKKQIKVYDLIQYCSLDRSTMYKIIHGTRKPSSEALFHKIAEFLSLTPVEYEKFYQAYLIDKIGRETYYKRKCTEKHLMNFPNTFSREPVLFVENPEDFSEITSDACSPDALIHGQTGHTPPAQISRLSGCTVLSSRMELHHVLYEMFFQEASRQNGKIALLIQPDFDFLFSLLSSLKPKYSLKVEHTFCLSKTNQMSASHELYNLDYLSRILPLYFSSVDYHPYYFYEDIFAHSYSFNGISCIILTSQYAVTCTSDYKMGIFYTEPAVISMLWNLYDSYQNKCRPFAYVMDYLSGNSTTTFSENF